MLALLLVITLVSTPMQQVYAESMSDVIISAEEKLDDDQQMSSDEVENSGDADNIGELDNNQEIIDSDLNEKISEETEQADTQENEDQEKELESDNETVIEDEQQAETSNEPERPDDLIIGDYIKSNLDYNTPVYTSDTETYSNVPSTYPDEMNNLYDSYPSTRNQNPYGTCWAFSSIGLAEFDLINDSIKGNGTVDSSIDLSELQLAYFTYNSVWIL